jgi:ABC-2 type transport system ATP-binding protein
MAIIIENIKKNYGSREALKSVNLQIENGMFGLLGPNGAGKTTLLRIVATLIQPTEGKILVNSYNTAIASHRQAIRSQLGYLPQELAFYPDLTGREFLDYMGLLKKQYDRSVRRKQIEQLLGVVGLKSDGDRKIKTYSGGMKRRLGIAQAILGNPGIIIVDEPTVGLDPEERIRFRMLLTDLARDRIVILSTHVVEDIEQTCEQVAVLNDGQIAFVGSVQELITFAKGSTWQFLADSRYTLSSTLHIIAAVPRDEGIVYHVVGPQPEEGDLVKDVQPLAPTLEDGYVWLQHMKDSQLAG